MRFWGRRSAPIKESLLLKNVQRPQKWGFGSGQNLTTTNGCSKKTHLFKIWQNFKMRFLDRRSALSKEGLLWKYVQKPQKWGFGSGQNGPMTNRCSKKLICLKFDKILKCVFWSEGVLLAKKVFYGKIFRNPKNGGLDQFKFDLPRMGVPKN